MLLVSDQTASWYRPPSGEPEDAAGYVLRPAGAGILADRNPPGQQRRRTARSRSARLGRRNAGRPTGAPVEYQKEPKAGVGDLPRTWTGAGRPVACRRRRGWSGGRGFPGNLFGGEPVETIGWGSLRGGHQLITADPERLTAIAASLTAIRTRSSARALAFPPARSCPGWRSGWGDGLSRQNPKQIQSVCPPTPGTDGKPRQWNGVETLAAAPEAFYAFLARAGEAQHDGGEGRSAGRRPAGCAGSKGPTLSARTVCTCRRAKQRSPTNAGHDQTFKVACKVGPGFKLDYEVALRLLMDEYNPRCRAALGGEGRPPQADRRLREGSRPARVASRRGPQRTPQRLGKRQRADERQRPRRH